MRLAAVTMHAGLMSFPPDGKRHAVGLESIARFVQRRDMGPTSGRALIPDQMGTTSWLIPKITRHKVRVLARLTMDSTVSLMLIESPRDTPEK